MSNFEDVKNSEEELNIIKRIANQLAQPSYAGYPTCVNKKEYDVSLKSVPTEQIEVLLDEYSTEVIYINFIYYFIKYFKNLKLSINN